MARSLVNWRNSGRHTGGSHKGAGVMTGDAPQFDPIKYKQTTKQQWETAAEAWHHWGPTLAQWLGPATELMLDMAEVGTGSRVLDVAAGAGEQTMVGKSQEKQQ